MNPCPQALKALRFRWRILVASLAGIIAIATGQLPAQTHIGVWNRPVHEQWWKTHDDPGQWVAKRGIIHQELVEVFERLTPARAFRNDSFAGWVNHLKWLSLMPEDTTLHESFVALALDDRIRGLFLNHLSPYDDHMAAMRILCRIHRDQPRETLRHPELAVALSLVFDQPFPDGWPHHFYELIQPYVHACLGDNRIDQAAGALERAQRTFRAQEGSILDRDIKELQRLINARSSGS